SLLDALYPVDGLLHFRVEVLHADAGAIEAHPAVRRDVARLQEAWVELYREVAIGGRAQAEVARQAVEQLLELRRPQEIRRAAPQVDLYDFAITVEERSHPGDLAHQARDVGAPLGYVARDDAVAAAVEARAETVGDVQIQRQRLRDRLLVAAADVLAQHRFVEVRAEVRRRRIRCVARSGAIVAPQQIGVEQRSFVHGG